jgi:hypothetical protein
VYNALSFTYVHLLVLVSYLEIRDFLQTNLRRKLSLTSNLQLLPSFGICGASSTLPLTSSWRVIAHKGNLAFTLPFKLY